VVAGRKRAGSSGNGYLRAAVKPRRIVSGGQAGVDRGALDAALSEGWSCGGWCPAGRAAEDGTIPDRYPLRATAESDPAVRTRRNVEDSDGTLILCVGPPTGGTRLTVEICGRIGRPCLVLDGGVVTVAEAARRVAEFVSGNEIKTLNVAGPRASGWPGAYEYARAVIAALLSDPSV